MQSPKIIDEEVIVKMEPKIMLWNPNKTDVEMKFDARIYQIPAGQILKARANVARALLQDYSIYGIVEIQSTDLDHLEAKRIEGLTRVYDYLFNQLNNWINWMSDIRGQGRNILDEPLRVKELKVLISDLEDELEFPRRLLPSVYEEIEKDRKRIAELIKARRVKNPDLNAITPSLESKHKTPLFGKSKKCRRSRNKKSGNIHERYFPPEVLRETLHVDAPAAQN